MTRSRKGAGPGENRPKRSDLDALLETVNNEDHEHSPADVEMACPECVRRAAIQAEYLIDLGGPSVLLTFVSRGGYEQCPRLLAMVAMEMGRRLRPPSAVGPAYVCPTCGRASWHPEDARNKFCGVCGFEADRRGGR